MLRDLAGDVRYAWRGLRRGPGFTLTAVTVLGVYLDGQQAIIQKALKHNPTLGQNLETMDPLEWLTRIETP